MTSFLCGEDVVPHCSVGSNTAALLTYKQKEVNKQQTTDVKYGKADWIKQIVKQKHHQLPFVVSLGLGEMLCISFITCLGVCL